MDFFPGFSSLSIFILYCKIPKNFLIAVAPKLNTITSEDLVTSVGNVSQFFYFLKKRLKKCILTSVTRAKQVPSSNKYNLQ